MNASPGHIHADFPAKPGANVCLRSAFPSKKKDAAEFPAHSFYVEEDILARASPVFRDMFALGKTSQEGQAVQLEEDSMTVAHLLHSIQQDDIAKVPDPVKMHPLNVVQLFKASIKYQITTVQIIIEQSIRLRLHHQNDDIYLIDNMVPLMRLACTNDRKALVKDMIVAATKRSTQPSDTYILQLCACLDGYGSALMMQHIGAKVKSKATTISNTITRARTAMQTKPYDPKTIEEVLNALEIAINALASVG